MYRTVEDRLTYLEQQMERQAFQIELLQQVIAHSNENKLYQLIISSNMSRDCYNKLKAYTIDLERHVANGKAVALQEYISTFERILKDHHVYMNTGDLAEFIPKWLSSLNSPGFSPTLHKHFYH